MTTKITPPAREPTVAGKGKLQLPQPPQKASRLVGHHKRMARAGMVGRDDLLAENIRYQEGRLCVFIRGFGKVDVGAYVPFYAENQILSDETVVAICSATGQ